MTCLCIKCQEKCDCDELLCVRCLMDALNKDAAEIQQLEIKEMEKRIVR